MIHKIGGICEMCKRYVDELPGRNCHECSVAFKTRLVDDWQARNKKLETVYDSFKDGHQRESRHSWRRFWLLFVRLWRLL